MGDPRKMFALDQNAADNGIDLDYGDFLIRILPALQSNPRYTAKLREVFQRYRSTLKVQTISAELDTKIMAEVYADTIIVGWTNVTDAKGKAIPFTRDNVIALLIDVPLLFVDIRQQAETIALFRASQTEETVKN